jgi:FAD:protein FMN transferase
VNGNGRRGGAGTADTAAPAGRDAGAEGTAATAPPAGPAVTAGRYRTDLVRHFRAMATDVTCQVAAPRAGAASALHRAQEVFHRVEAACTRFDPASPLMLANAAPRRWHRVPDELYLAVEEAAAAHRETGGLFDPRVLDVLRSWGYDRSLAFADRPDLPAPPRPAPRPPGHRPWRPRFSPQRRAVRLGADPIDLGGIGKGLAVRWAAAELAGCGAAALVEAGGDLHAAGAGPDGDGWRVAVEDPRGGAEPVVVLRIADAACATSSVRIRHWRVAGRPVHHLIDPRTGAPGGTGLLAVTVVDPDPVHAEVWSKALFLAGRGAVRAVADSHGIAALLVDAGGTVGMSRAMRPHLLWQVPRAW